MKHILILSALVLGAMLAAVAQEKHVSVTGEASTLTMPDRAVVTMDVIAREEKSADVLETLNKKIRKMLEPLKVAGLESKNLVISGYKIEPVYFREEKETRTEFVATATFKITLANINRVGDVLDKALNNGASTCSDPVYFLSQDENVKAQMLDKAIQDAKTKAGKIAESLGGAIGKPLRAAVSYDVKMVPTNDGKADVFAVATTSKGPVLAPFQLSVSAKVDVDFELVGN